MYDKNQFIDYGITIDFINSNSRPSNDDDEL